MSDWHNIGFTGSSEVTTEAQRGAVIDWLDNWEVEKFHHGDCVEADAFAHSVVRSLWASAKIVLHPPVNDSKRARCEADECREPLPYLERNRAIVDEAGALLAMPKGPEELRSGTWSTIRYARKLGKPVVIFWPDGSVKTEANGPRNQQFAIQPPN